MRPHPLEAKSNSSKEEVEKLIPVNRNGNPLRPSVDLRNIDVTQLPGWIECLERGVIVLML